MRQRSHLTRTDDSARLSADEPTGRRPSLRLIAQARPSTRDGRCGRRLAAATEAWNASSASITA